MILSSTNEKTLSLNGGAVCLTSPMLFFNRKTAVEQSQAGAKYRRICRLYRLISEHAHQFTDPHVKIVLPTVSGIQTDCFDWFVDRRGQNLRQKAVSAANDAEIIQSFMACDFSKPQEKELIQTFARHPGPIMLRASTLWEDGTHINVNDLFSTIFLPNNHRDPKVNLRHFLNALKRLYADAFTSNVREQAISQGLMPGTIQMAVVVQDMPGLQTSIADGKTYLYPAYSFYANSFNDYAYDRIHPHDGYFKLAFGLGTGVKTKDMNHAWRVNLGSYPTFAGLKSDVKMFDQRPTFAYALSLDGFSGLGVDGNGNLVSLQTQYLSESMKQRHLCFYNPAYQKLEGSFSLNLHSEREEAMIFGSDFIQNKPGSITRVINELLCLLKEEYRSEVGLEGSADYVLGADGSNLLVVSLLDAHMQPRAWNDRLEYLPTIAEEQVVFRGEKAIGRGRYRINSIVEVKSEYPTYTYGFSIAEEISQINRELKPTFAGGGALLLSPGRIGTRSKGEGVPVSFWAVNQFQVLVEKISGESTPSQGCHFLQDVVANNMACCSYRNSDALDLTHLGSQIEYVEEREYTRIYHLKQPLEFVIDEQKNSMLYRP